ncbi:MAG: cytochrome c-type biogenesis protein CcmH [Gammaproteobacteria bacterium PRO9]|nr:cytochrome c-type biogenesis protein CcmH [Gammaproteobacteria bacterium PRO9]
MPRHRSFITLLVLVAVSLLRAGAALAVDQDPPLKDPGQQAIYERLIHEIRCVVCLNQTIADSTAPLAAGQTEDEVKTFLLNRYGDFVLYRPRFTLETALLWLAPGLLLVIGGLALFGIVRRRAALPVPPDDPVDDQSAP